MHTPEVMVLGLGAAGSAALYHLARRGARVLGVDRHAPPHAHGSTHGESRITRQATAEGEAYVPLVRRSHDLWRALEAESGETLLRACGGLVLGAPAGDTPDFVGRTIEAARRHAIAHEVLDAPELAGRFPQLELRGDERGYYEPGAGLLDPEACVRAHLDLARRRGAAVHTGEQVLGLAPLRDGVRVTTTAGEYHAGQVIVSLGAWTAEVLGAPLRGLLQVRRQVLYWFAPEDAAWAQAYAPGRFPVFIWHHGAHDEDSFYGFPQLGEGVKVATEQVSETTAPDSVRREVTAAEAGAMYAGHVRGRLRGVSARLVRAATCLYTVTPDHDFILDRHPDSGRVLLASPCSGHGFKHSAAIGEALALWALGEQAPADLRPFALSRFVAG